MRYWWVNQNQTYRAEVRGSFMWSPKRNANGARNQFYENMRAVAPGDVIFSFCDTRIKAIGVVTSPAETGPKPDFGSAGMNWSGEGWFVPVDYCTLEHQVRPKDHIDIIRPFLPAKYSPLQTNGDGLQSVYLAELPESLAQALIGLIGQAYWNAYETIANYQTAADSSEPDENIIDRGIVGPTFKDQVVKSRRGQGVFRANVLLRESACRPRRSDFGRGSIRAPRSPRAVAHHRSRSPPLLDAWGIDAVRVGEFSREQNAYLDYHRANVRPHEDVAPTRFHLAF